MPPPPPLTEEPEDTEWLTTYADAITLLMAFFVMLASFSKIDLPMFEAVMAGIKQEIGLGKETAVSTSQELSKSIEAATFEFQMEQVVEVQKDERGITIDMAAASFFRSGTAEILPGAYDLLHSWSKMLTDERFKYFYIEVEGHTDDDPINTPQFPSNWELSAARASAVVRFMQEDGIHPFQMKAVGLGDSHPKVPNRDQFGDPLPLNQAKNRRIIMRLVQMAKADKETFQDVLLEERLAEEARKRREAEEKRRQEIQERVNAAEQESQGGGEPDATAPMAPNTTPNPPMDGAPPQ